MFHYRYCHLRETCDILAKKLRNLGFNAHSYHAGMTHPKRQDLLRKWQKNIASIVVATISFGMGIDKPNVEYVVHYDMPSTLAGYTQESGRAARSLKSGVCRMYCSKDECERVRNHDVSDTHMYHM